MVTYSQNEDFMKKIMVSNALTEAIDYIRYNFTPEEIFYERDLRQWALDNDFIET